MRIPTALYLVIAATGTALPAPGQAEEREHAMHRDTKAPGVSMLRPERLRERARERWSDPHDAVPVPLDRLGATVTLDGRPDEAVWQRVVPLPMTMYEPTFQGNLTERTEIRVAYDDDHLYVAGAFYDSEPEAIRANSLYRDQSNESDAFELILDTFDDNENALVFGTTPAGVRFDMAVSGDARSSNRSWNTYWDVVTRITDKGWFAEMKIPFSSLGFEARGGEIVMGLTAVRTIARKSERHVYPAISNSWSVYASSQASDVVIEGVHAQEPIYVTPYALGGIGRRAALNPSESGYVAQGDVTRDIGLDVKYNLTSNLTLDATVNTDFAQVEADDQQVNLTRFSLVFPEKRQFFQERSGLFDFGTRNEQLFHSRRIGIRQGEAIPILGGVRLVGRRGAWDVGILDMQTAASGDVPTENFGVARLRRRVFNENSTAGGILTSRIDGDGGYNIAYGLDGVFRVVGHEYLLINWAQTFDDAIIDGGDFELSRSGLFQARWERRDLEGWSYFTSLTWSGEDFVPDMGFIRRRNYTEVGGLLHLNRFPGADSPFQRTMFVHLDGFTAFRNTDGTVESAGVRYLPMAWFKDGSVAMISFNLDYESLRSPIGFVNASTVDAGSYYFGTVGASYTTSTKTRYRLAFNADAGAFYDGRRMGMGLSPEWNPSPHFQLSGSYSLASVRFDERGEGFDAHLLGMRIRTALNTRASANAFLQFSSAFELATANLRLRYNFREGSDLWLVYNEGLNTDRRRLDPALPISNERTILLKYTYTFDAHSL